MRRAIIFALFALASFMAPVQAQWAEAYNSSGAFNGFHFTDSLNGWFTHLGTEKIVHTSDGGYSFQVQPVFLANYSMNDVYMEDNLNGWACGTNTGSGPGYIFRTTNGGADWVQITHPASQSGWWQIEMVDQSIWFIGSLSVTPNSFLIMKTSDNGITWDLTSYSQFDASSIFIFDSLNFIVYADEGVLARTTDGGNSWISANLPPDYQVEKVMFLDNNLGYALVTDLSHFPRDVYLYKSTDGGFAWNIHYSWLATAQKGDLSIIPETGTIFVAGYLDQSGAKGILKSNDDGTSWNTFSTNYLVTGLYTPSRYSGWAGAGAMIYRYDYVEPPVVQPIPNALIQMGAPFQYQVEASGLGLKYTMSGNPNGLNIGLYSGLIQGTPSPGGNFPITVTVKDTDANAVNSQFSLRVNRKPLFLPPFPPIHAWVDSLYEGLLTATDNDGDTLSFSALQKPDFLEIISNPPSNTALLQGTPAITDTGFHNISITADDGYGGVDTLNFVLRVRDYNNPPQFIGSWMDTVIVYKDSSYTWHFDFKDIDGDTLFTIVGNIGVPGLEVLEEIIGIGTVTSTVSGAPTDMGLYQAAVNVKDELGLIGSLEFTVIVEIITAVNPDEELPTEFILYQNYPNPFNPTTKIKFTIPQADIPLLGEARGGLVTLKVYDLLSNEITTLINEVKQPGVYEVEFDASSLTSGVYFYQLKAGEFISTKKLLLLK